MAEIDEEVRRRRASGDLPARVERELDELFLQLSPVAGRGGGLDEVLRMVDASAYIDPVVPVGSAKSGGAVVKKGVRQLSLWYMAWITAQVGQFAGLGDPGPAPAWTSEVTELARQLEDQRVPPAPVIEQPWAARADVVVGGRRSRAWWPTAPGRVLHAACGDGWLVRRLAARGVDAYGDRPPAGPGRPGRDRRDRPARRAAARPPAGRRRRPAWGPSWSAAWSRPWRPASGTACSTWSTTGWPPTGPWSCTRSRLAAWGADDAPPEVDLAPGPAPAPATWSHLSAARGYGVTGAPGPDGADYLVVAMAGAGVPAIR